MAEAIVSSEQINPLALRNFVKHVCIVSKKYSDREAARDKLNKQIKKLKKTNLSKAKRKFLEKEVNVLNIMIGEVLKKESDLLKLGKEENEEIVALRSKINILENELNRTKISKNNELTENKTKINELTNSIADLREKIGEFIGMRAERERKIEELEKRVRESAPPNPQILALKEQLKRLETKYIELSKKNRNKKELAKVENRINLLKRTLSV